MNKIICFYVLLLSFVSLNGQIIVTEPIDARLIPILDEKDSLALKEILRTDDYHMIPNFIKHLQLRERNYLVQTMVYLRSKSYAELFDFMAKNLMEYDLLLPFPKSNFIESNNESIIDPITSELLALYILHHDYLSDCNYFGSYEDILSYGQNISLRRHIGYFFKDYTAEINAKLEKKITDCEKANLLFILDAINH